jgi:glycosyltransferase involved in cell wall biosynthesis
VILPTYFDGKTLRELIPEIKFEVSKQRSFKISVILVIDDSIGADLDLKTVRLFSNVKILKPKKNLGNQKSIISGILQAKKIDPTITHFLIMDSDGEDDPKGIFRILKSLDNEDLELVVVKRGRRNDIDFQTKVMLNIFKVLFRILTGKTWLSGNFSAFKTEWFDKNIETFRNSNVFASLLQALPAKRAIVSLDRSARRFGQSVTNRHTKITYALDSLLPWVKMIQIRSLIFFALSALNFLICSCIAVAGRFIWNFAAPNWFTIIVLSTLGLTFISLNIFLATYTLRYVSSE